jgi:hypothetical protein
VIRGECRNHPAKNRKLQDAPTIHIGTERIQRRLDFNLLGQWVSVDGDSMVDVKRRIAQASEEFFQMSELWYEPKLEPVRKLPVYEAVIAKALYG